MVGEFLLRTDEAEVVPDGWNQAFSDVVSTSNCVVRLIIYVDAYIFLPREFRCFEHSDLDALAS